MIKLSKIKTFTRKVRKTKIRSQKDARRIFFTYKRQKQNFILSRRNKKKDIKY